MHSLDITRQAKSFLEGLDAKRFKQVANKFFSLMDNPEPHDSCKLSGYSYRRADIGEYRIIYHIENHCLKVALVGKRNDDEVYKQLKRATS